MSNLKLNESTLKLFCEHVSKKKVPAVNEAILVKEFLTYMQMHNEHMRESSVYEIASAIRSFEMWYSNKDKDPNKKHIAQYRDVFYADLGAHTLKYESGFIHPSIVIRRYGSSVLVVPCSSKKYGKNDDLIFDIKKGGVFRENTGALLDQTRTISVTRLKGKMGRVDTQVFDDLLDEFMKKYLCKKYKEHEDLIAKNKKLQKNIIEKDTLIKELQLELETLKQENVSKDDD